MMNRKKYFYTVIIILFLFCLGFLINDRVFTKNVDDKYQAGIYTIVDLEVIDTKTNNRIRVGMTKEKVTDLFGQESEIDFRNIYNFDGLRVYFRDNKVAAMMVQASDNITKRFITRRDVGLGTEMKIVLDSYGEAKVEDVFGSYSITYIGKLDGTKFMTNENNDPEWLIKEQDKIYLISFSFFNNINKTLSDIIISDHKFAYTGM
jgi:hypothetical protein